MNRHALLRFGLAGIALALAAWIGFGRAADRLDKPQATALAGRLLAAYAEQSGEPARHFAPQPTVDYPDGWEFGWSYAPCPEVARLRVFIGRNGRADYSETPDCAPAQGLGAPLTRA